MTPAEIEKLHRAVEEHTLPPCEECGSESEGIGTLAMGQARSG